jgi:hypothetical protein
MCPKDDLDTRGVGVQGGRPGQVTVDDRGAPVGQHIERGPLPPVPQRAGSGQQPQVDLRQE